MEQGRGWPDRVSNNKREGMFGVPTRPASPVFRVSGMDRDDCGYLNSANFLMIVAAPGGLLAGGNYEDWDNLDHHHQLSTGEERGSVWHSRACYILGDITVILI